MVSSMMTLPPTGSQLVDDRGGKRCIVAHRQPGIGDDVGIAQHPERAAADADLAHQDVFAIGEERRQFP